MRLSLAQPLKLVAEGMVCISVEKISWLRLLHLRCFLLLLVLLASVLFDFFLTSCMHARMALATAAFGALKIFSILSTSLRN